MTNHETPRPFRALAPSGRDDNACGSVKSTTRRPRGCRSLDFTDPEASSPEGPLSSPPLVSLFSSSPPSLPPPPSIPDLLHPKPLWKPSPPRNLAPRTPPSRQTSTNPAISGVSSPTSLASPSVFDPIELTDRCPNRHPLDHRRPHPREAPGPHPDTAPEQNPAGCVHFFVAGSAITASLLLHESFR